MLRWSLLVMSCFISALAVAQTGSQSAFESGKTFGEGKNQGIFSGITGGAAQSNIPRYGYSTPEANHFAGGKGETSGPGVGKINSCANYAPGPDKVANQECEAVNFLARNPQVRPQFTIGPNDPLIQKYKQYKSNAEQAFAQFFPGGTGSQSQCVTRNETIPGQYSTETCVSAQEVGTNQCTMGRVINIDTDANFQCEQTLNSYETVTCNKTISTTIARSFQYKMGDQCQEVFGVYCDSRNMTFFAQGQSAAWGRGYNKVMANGSYLGTLSAPLQPGYFSRFGGAQCSTPNCYATRCDYLLLRINGADYSFGRGTIISYCGTPSCTQLTPIVSSEGIVGYACNSTGGGSSCPAGWTAQPDGSCLENTFYTNQQNCMYLGSVPTVIANTASATEHRFACISTADGCASLQ